MNKPNCNYEEQLKNLAKKKEEADEKCCALWMAFFGMLGGIILMKGIMDCIAAVPLDLEMIMCFGIGFIFIGIGLVPAVMSVRKIAYKCQDCGYTYNPCNPLEETTEFTWKPEAEMYCPMCGCKTMHTKVSLKKKAKKGSKA